MRLVVVIAHGSPNALRNPSPICLVIRRRQLACNGRLPEWSDMAATRQAAANDKHHSQLLLTNNSALVSDSRFAATAGSEPRAQDSSQYDRHYQTNSNESRRKLAFNH